MTDQTISDFRALEIRTERGYRVLDQALFSPIVFSLEEALDKMINDNVQRLDIVYVKNGITSRYVLMKERRK